MGFVVCLVLKASSLKKNVFAEISRRIRMVVCGWLRGGLLLGIH